MTDHEKNGGLDRRGFFKTAGAGLSAAGLVLTGNEAPAAAPAEWSEKDKLARIASCTWPIRYIFKTRPPAGGRGGRGGGGGGGGQTSGGMTTAQLKEKYGEITMLDFPQFTKDTFPGVTHMDLFSGLFGDVTDDSMFTGGRGFDPMSLSGRKWLDKLAANMATTGVKCQHISNNAPTNLAGPDEALRKEGVEIAKKWLEGCAVLGVKSMRMNSTSALGPGIRPNAIPKSSDGYPRNLDILPLLAAAIESYKEMADYGGNLGIKVTFENHWGLAADPMNIRIMLDTINHPYCEASPDFCNWEHDYMLFPRSQGARAVLPHERAREVLGSLG